MKDWRREAESTKKERWKGEETEGRSKENERQRDEEKILGEGIYRG